MVADAAPRSGLTTPGRVQHTDQASTSRAAADTLGSAERRITRQFAVFVGAGYLAYALIELAPIRESLAFMDSWWAIGAPAVVFGSGAAIGVAGLVGSVPAIRWAVGCAAAAYALAVLTTWLGWSGEVGGGARGLWFTGFPGLVALAVGVVWPGPRAVVYLAGASVAVVLASDVTKSADHRISVWPDIAYAFGYCLPFVAASMIAMRTARLLDRTREATYAIAGETAAADARAAERARFDALTHDGAMAVLLGASRLGATAEIRALAHQTIDDLTAMEADDGASVVTSPAAAAARLRTTITLVDDSLTPHLQLPDPHLAHIASLPAIAVDTVAAALGESLRNVRRHARASVVDVSIRLDENSIVATVVDDGCGFVIDAVPPHRLGIAVSIVGRMRQLDGGAATVTSAPDAGTTVRLSWTAPRADAIR